jgi:hypothetical protein
MPQVRALESLILYCLLSHDLFSMSDLCKDERPYSGKVLCFGLLKRELFFNISFLLKKKKKHLLCTKKCCVFVSFVTSKRPCECKKKTSNTFPLL